MKVEISYERQRLCGYRKPSKDGVGIYLRGSPFGEACERLPWLLDICKCCVPPGEIVSGTTKTIEELIAGDKVWSRNGWTEITDTFSREYSGEMITIEAEGLLPITVTAEHPILVVERTSNSNCSPTKKWVVAKDVAPKHSSKRGHYLVVPKCQPGDTDVDSVDISGFAIRRIMRKGYREDFPINEDTAWLLGSYVADGNSSTSGVIFNYGKQKTHLHKRATEIAMGLRYSPCTIEVPTAMRVEISSRLLARAFPLWCGDKAHTKQIPDFILHHRNDAILQAFLAGYEAGDGSTGISKGTESTRCTTVSRQLASDLQLANARLGRFARIYIQRRAGKSKILGRDVTIRDRYSVEYKTQGEKLLTSNKTPDQIWVRVKKVSRAPYKGVVHNIETRNHTFALSNAVTHNCGQGYKQSRGFTWINPMNMFDPFVEPACTVNLADDPFSSHRHEQCWMCNPELLGSMAGLIWIGEKFYATPTLFLRESDQMGISRKISAIPNGFEIGTHVIFLAHIRTFSSRLPDGKIEYKPGVFAAFKPTSIDLVVDDPSNVPEKALTLAKRIGHDKCRLVKVIPDKSEDEEGIWEDMEEA